MYYLIISEGDVLKKTYKIAVSGICTALSVVLMFLGGVMYFFSYVTPLLLGVLMMIINKTFGKSCALTTFAAVSVLSMLLVTEKESVLLYILFFGYYPVIKTRLDAVTSKFIRIILKLLLFNISLALTELLAFYVFGIPFFEDGINSIWIVIAFAAAMNLIFVMYELLLNKFFILYVNGIESKIKKLFK